MNVQTCFRVFAHEILLYEVYNFLFDPTAAAAAADDVVRLSLLV